MIDIPTNFYLRSDEVLVEVRNPHQHWRTIGLFAANIQTFHGVETVTPCGRFLLQRDGAKFFVDVSEQLVDCHRCHRSFKRKYGNCIACEAAKKK